MGFSLAASQSTNKAGFEYTACVGADQCVALATTTVEELVAFCLRYGK